MKDNTYSMYSKFDFLSSAIWGISLKYLLEKNQEITIGNNQYTLLYQQNDKYKPRTVEVKRLLQKYIYLAPYPSQGSNLDCFRDKCTNHGQGCR